MAIRSSDQISIVDLTDGYAVILTTDSYTFAGDTTKVKSTQSFSVGVYAYCGATSVAAAVNATTLNNSLPAGLSVVSDGDATAPTLTFTATTDLTQAALTSAGGRILIPVIVDGGEITISKSLALSIALTGAGGTSAYSITLGNESQVIACNADGTVSEATTIEIPFSVFQGTSRKAATVTYSTLPSGMTLNKNTAGTTSAEGKLILNVAAGARLGGTSNGLITLTIKTGSTTVGTKVFYWAKSTAGADGFDAITLTITSSNGTIFKNTGVNTVLTAHVYQAGAELNSDAVAALGTIKWYKDGSATALATTGATLTITDSDVNNKEVYVARLERD